MSLEKLIEGLPKRDVAQLCKQRLNVVDRLATINDVDAIKLRDAIDVELIARLDAPIDGWSTGAQGEPRYFMRGGDKAAVVYRNETHGVDRGDYSIEIDGQKLADVFRFVEEARNHVDRILGGA